MVSAAMFPAGGDKNLGFFLGDASGFLASAASIFYSVYLYEWFCQTLFMKVGERALFSTLLEATGGVET